MCKELKCGMVMIIDLNISQLAAERRIQNQTSLFRVSHFRTDCKETQVHAWSPNVALVV